MNNEMLSRFIKISSIFLRSWAHTGFCPIQVPWLMLVTPHYRGDLPSTSSWGFYHLTQKPLFSPPLLLWTGCELAPAMHGRCIRLPSSPMPSKSTGSRSARGHGRHYHSSRAGLAHWSGSAVPRFQHSFPSSLWEGALCHDEANSWWSRSCYRRIPRRSKGCRGLRAATLTSSRTGTEWPWDRDGDRDNDSDCGSRHTPHVIGAKSYSEPEVPTAQGPN